MKRMLINATQPEELRLAMVDGQSLYDFDLEQLGHERKRANIYKARVSRVEQSLGAAFVDYGAEKHGFLPMKEIAPQYLPGGKLSRNISIKNCLKEGDEIIVQVEKEERGTKGAALTTFITLAGHYIVLLPNNSEAGGISRSLEGKDRDSIKAIIRSLDVPEKMGLIVRTAAKGVSKAELEWDLDYLLSVWDAILEANQLRKAPFLVYRESDLITRSLRDYLRDDIKEVLIDSEEAHEKAMDFITKLMPEYEDRIIQYSDTTPLFTKYQIEAQIDTAQQREVNLPSGGSVCIDQTEALVAIDINSAKSTKGSNIEDTASKTNLEAATEIAKQLRLRDIGGLVVIDFIDMVSLKNKRQVEEAMWDAVALDRAKIQIGRISRFGLLEMSRQRLRPSLQERWQQDISSLSTAVLRLIEEESAKENSLEIRANVSTEMSVFLLNERRARINEIEQKASIRIVIKADPTREDDRYEVIRIKVNDAKNNNVSLSDNELQTKKIEKKTSFKPSKHEKAAVDIKPKARPIRKNEGFFERLIKGLLGKKKEKDQKDDKESNKKNLGSNKGSRAKNNNKKITGQSKSKQPYKSNNKVNNKKQDSKDKTSIKAKHTSKPEKNKKETNTRDKPSKKSNNKSVDGNKALLPDEVSANKELNKDVNGNKANYAKDSLKKEKKTELDIELDSSQDKPNSETKSAKDWGKATNDPRAKKITEKKMDTVNEKKIKLSTEENKKDPIKESIIETKKDPIKESIEEKQIDLETKKEEQEIKSAKDWGKASNDPRNKE
tara:strand:+ start:75 stop:2408 length:2334 start_codon:yes stop_codon:yes gene_type:complete